MVLLSFRRDRCGAKVVVPVPTSLTAGAVGWFPRVQSSVPGQKRPPDEAVPPPPPNPPPPNPPPPPPKPPPPPQLPPQPPLCRLPPARMPPRISESGSIPPLRRLPRGSSQRSTSCCASTSACSPSCSARVNRLAASVGLSLALR